MGRKAQPLNDQEVIEYYKTHSLANTIKHFKSSDASIINVLTKNNIPKHNPMDSRKLTYQEKFGVNEYSETDIFKNKIKETWKNKTTDEIKTTVDKRKHTKLEKYGNASYNNPNSISKTLLDRTDEEKEITKNKRAKTCLEIYGNECFSKTKEFVKRFHNTWDNKPKEELEDRNNKIRDSYLNTILNKYGVDGGYVLTDKCRKSNNSTASNSKPNKNFENLLISNNILNYEKEFVLNKYIYDFKINDILIEINPTATHNITWCPYGDKAKISKDYHYNKTKNALNNGYKCICVWDWINPEYIINLIKSGFNQFQNEIKRHISDCNGKEHQIISYNDPTPEGLVEIYDDGSEYKLIN